MPVKAACFLCKYFGADIVYYVNVNVKLFSYSADIFELHTIHHLFETFEVQWGKLGITPGSQNWNERQEQDELEVAFAEDIGLLYW